MAPDNSEISVHTIESASNLLMGNGFYFEQFLLVLFAGLGVIAFLSQLVPGILLFASMIRSICSCARSSMGTPGDGLE